MSQSDGEGIRTNSSNQPQQDLSTPRQFPHVDHENKSRDDPSFNGTYVARELLAADGHRQQSAVHRHQLNQSSLSPQQSPASSFELVPRLKQLEVDNKKLQEENAALRAVFPDIFNNLFCGQADSNCLPTASFSGVTAYSDPVREISHSNIRQETQENPHSHCPCSIVDGRVNITISHASDAAAPLPDEHTPLQRVSDAPEREASDRSITFDVRRTRSESDRTDAPMRRKTIQIELRISSNTVTVDAECPSSPPPFSLPPSIAHSGLPSHTPQ